MKKTTKIIISFAVAIAVAATVLIVAVFKKDETQLQPSVLYTLQPTVVTNPQDTNAWIDPNALWSDLVSDTDAAVTATTIFQGGVTVPGTGTSNVTQFIYVDPFGNIIDPNNISPGVSTPVNNQPGGEVMDDGTMPQNSTEAGDLGFSEFEVNSNGVLTKYNGSEGFVIIPQKVNGISVTGIGDSCFANSTIKSVYIHEGITSIGKSAFENCSYLDTVSFVNSSTKITIGGLAFKNCPSLTKIHLPVVTAMGPSVFSNCNALSAVSFADGSAQIGAYCFDNCKAISSVTIPGSVTDIGQDVFYGCGDYGRITVITPSGSTAETYAQDKGIATRVP